MASFLILFLAVALAEGARLPRAHDTANRDRAITPQETNSESNRLSQQPQQVFETQLGQRSQSFPSQIPSQYIGVGGLNGWEADSRVPYGNNQHGLDQFGFSNRNQYGSDWRQQTIGRPWSRPQGLQNQLDPTTFSQMNHFPYPNNFQTLQGQDGQNYGDGTQQIHEKLCLALLDLKTTVEKDTQVLPLSANDFKTKFLSMYDGKSSMNGNNYPIFRDDIWSDVINKMQLAQGSNSAFTLQHCLAMLNQHKPIGRQNVVPQFGSPNSNPIQWQPKLWPPRNGGIRPMDNQFNQEPIVQQCLSILTAKQQYGQDSRFGQVGGFRHDANVAYQENPVDNTGGFIGQ